MAQARRSWAPLVGVAYVVLMVASFVVGGDTPPIEDSGEEIITFYQDNDAKVIASLLLLGLSAVLFLFFAGLVRSFLRVREGETGWLSAVAFGGAIVSATGMLIFGGLGFTLVDGSDSLPPTAMQAINALNYDLFLPLVAGMAAFLFATGLSGVRSGALPRWLAWIALIFGVALFTPIGFFVFLASLLWVLAASIWMLRGPRTPGTAAQGPPA